MTEGGVAYFDRYMRLSDKQRSPQKIDQELASFMEVREQVENDASIAPNKRQEALLLVDRSVQDWTQLKEAAADFHQKAKTGPMYALALERAAVPLVSEDPALHARVLSETLANANTASPQTANTPEQSGENLATLIRSGLKLALAANKDEAELFGSAGLATLQNQRESWLLASATNTRAISIVLMGAGHSFGDNISALGLSSRVGLIEVIPKKVMEIANS
jgi:hypothetical protein